eukprot:m.264330 g.264330  ORF g.264330 m.264330 type:complete len:422 (-) comp19249_c0_seq7:28-1293(-)
MAMGVVWASRTLCRACRAQRVLQQRPRGLCEQAAPAPPWTILGIESSFDDTAVAVVRGTPAAHSSFGAPGSEVLSSVAFDQRALHKNTGGTVPRTAGQLHRLHLPRVTQEALQLANVSMKDIDVIAFTQGPGLGPCLQAGLEFAKELGESYRVPLMPVHHMEGHLLSGRIEHPAVCFPYLSLLASGGHCLLLLAAGIGQYHRLGHGLDDAPGEAYDKLARLMGLERGGPDLATLAEQGCPTRFSFKTPMHETRSCDFSFSGLKTAVIRMYEQERLHVTEKNLSQLHADLAAGFQKAVCQHLSTRTARALEYCKLHGDVRDVVFAGGVASNLAIRNAVSQRARQYGAATVCPSPALCVDNAIMIAWVAVEHLAHAQATGAPPSLCGPTSALRYIPRWPLGQDDRCRVTKTNIKVPLSNTAQQ